MDQLAVRERRRTALDAEGGELLVERGEDAGVLVPVRLPARPVGDRVARERRRQRRILQLERIARHDPCPRAPGREDRREADDVVLDHDVGLDLGHDLCQPLVDVARPVAERTERRLDELAQLVERRLAEDRCGLADEVLPELARLLLGLRRRAESHQPLLEPLRLEAPRERLLDHEHDPVPALAQHLPDSDAVVRRAISPLGKEHDRRRLCSMRPLAPSLVSRQRRIYENHGDLRHGTCSSARAGLREGTRRGRVGPTPGSSPRAPTARRSSSSTWSSPTEAGSARAALRDGRECAGDDPLWPALARESGGGAHATGFLAEDLSNTVVLLDEGRVLKLYRRPEPGTHPEVEVLAALEGSPHAPTLEGRLERDGVTHVSVQASVPGEPVGWEPLIARSPPRSASGLPTQLAHVTACCITPSPSASARPRTGSSRYRRSPRRPVPALRRGARRRRLGGRPGLRSRSDAARDPPSGLAWLRLSLAHAAGPRTPEPRLRLAAGGRRRDEALGAYGDVDRELLHALEVEKELGELAYASPLAPRMALRAAGVLPFVLEERREARRLLRDILAAPERLAACSTPTTSRRHSGAPAGARRVVLIGMGSSRFAALPAAALLRSRGVPAVAELASTGLPTVPRRTCSRSASRRAERAETVAALERHRA